MNAQRLLQHYERIADAPDAIPRLRRFVLDLAVRGKLVPQDPSDEPASELLKWIKKKNTELGRTGKVTNPARPSSNPNGEPGFTMPTGWIWTTLGTVSNVVMGQSPPGDTYNTEGVGVPLINGPVEFSAGPFGRTVVNQYTSAPTNFCEEGDLLICVRGSTTGRTNIAGFRACIGRGVAAIQSDFDDAFLRLFIWKERERIIEMGRGIAFPSVSRRQIEDLAIPLPPLAEQRRIVIKIDELMTLCDRLEQARAEKEARRDRLTVAILARLNAPDPETFRDAARFALATLPAITARTDQIKQLRQTILNLAVRGKLVPQSANYGPASELLKRIKVEKARLVKAGAIPRQKEIVRDLSSLIEGLPVSWEPMALGEACAIVTSGSRGWAQFYANSGPSFIRAQNIRFGKLKLDDLAFVKPPSNSEGSRTRVAKGDLFIVITGAGVTNPALLDCDLGEAYVSQHVGLVRPIDKQLSEWFLLCLMAPAGGRAELVERAYGAGRPGLNLDNIRTLGIPLPPLAEQRRIVTKVDELMVLCDRLEGCLAAADDTRRHLLAALLAEALAPDQERELEAAE